MDADATSDSQEGAMLLLTLQQARAPRPFAQQKQCQGSRQDPYVIGQQPMQFVTLKRQMSVALPVA